MSNKENSNAIIIGQDANQIAVNIRVSVKTRRVSICISAIRGVELVVPRRFNYDQAYNFLVSKENWIRKQLSKQAAVTNSRKDHIPIFGESHKIVQIKGSLPISLREGCILVSDNQLPIMHMDIKFFLRALLKQEITQSADKISKLLNVKYNKISIKDTTSRWGSCTTNGNLSFSWRLVFAPKSVVEYVVVHELCHLIEMNHSSRFWNLVENICPNYSFSRQWLRKHTRLLHTYLIADNE